MLRRTGARPLTQGRPCRGLPQRRDRGDARPRRAGLGTPAGYPRYGTSLEAGRRGDWTLVVEVGGYQAADPALLGDLSGGSAVVTLIWTVNADIWVQVAVDGAIIRRLAPLTGTTGSPHNGGPLPQEDAIPIGVDHWRSAAFALLQRVTAYRSR